MLDTIADAGYEGCGLGPVAYLTSEPDDVARRFDPHTVRKARHERRRPICCSIAARDLLGMTL